MPGRELDLLLKKFIQKVTKSVLLLARQEKIPVDDLQRRRIERAFLDAHAAMSGRGIRILRGNIFDEALHLLRQRGTPEEVNRFIERVKTAYEKGPEAIQEQRELGRIWKTILNTLRDRGILSPENQDQLLRVHQIIARDLQEPWLPFERKMQQCIDHLEDEGGKSIEQEIVDAVCDFLADEIERGQEAMKEPREENGEESEGALAGESTVISLFDPSRNSRK